MAAISKNSWILVTGVNGFLASHTAKQFLERGYKVRGSVRDLKKSAWLVQDVFKAYAGRGVFELVEVPDLAVEHAFDNAVKGVSAIAHVATIVTFDADPNKVIPQTVSGTTSILEAALKEPSVKSFVYTSSVVAASFCAPEDKAHIGQDTWNEAALELAWAPPPYNPDRAMIVYMASKTAAEKALWKFTEDRKPHFRVNAVLPCSIMGECLNRKHSDSPFNWLKPLYDGDSPKMAVPATIHNDVKDSAILHVAAILDPQVKNARLSAWGEYCNWNDVLAIMRKLCPERTFISDLPDLSKLSITTDFNQEFTLLEKWAGQKGWKTLEETIADTIPNFQKWYS